MAGQLLLKGIDRSRKMAYITTQIAYTGVKYALASSITTKRSPRPSQTARIAYTEAR